MAAGLLAPPPIQTPDASSPGETALLATTLLASLPDAVVSLAAVRSGNGAVTDFEWQTANPAALRMFGGRLAGRRLRGDGANGGCVGLFACLMECMTSGRSVQRVLTVGNSRWRIAAGPSANGVGATIIDLGPEKTEGGSPAALIAELRARETEARAARREAERASRAKSEFLAHMSHELRTPLNAVLGFAELLLDETFGPLGSARYRAYAEDIHQSGAHLLALINDILDLSRIEAGRMELREEGVDVAETARQTTAMVAEQAIERGVILASDLSDDMPLLLGDSRALKQMLLNLLSNAIKFTPAGGQVLLTASQLPDGGIGLMVADTGVGIAEENIARVLEPFGRGDIATARQSEGTGLGLPIVKRLMELHGGRLDLASEPGVGTTAILIFPAERGIPRTAIAPFPQQARPEQRQRR
ncbi:sensor histidine kinase [Azospirillum soli]|uniref:sensor histidine kinase n=1 Tax=Azospirillum soli TaxID=1304799 RepID=UPI001AE19431|nr:HAMP domain-containing sensor histidine kinase [Azospirillum soli]MBP2313237.1 two-component system cell cycle sensor histidine kinase PleC [Azospirillum soli]